MKSSRLEDQFAFQCKAMNLPEPLRNYRFDENRRWTLDFAWHDHVVVRDKDSTGAVMRGLAFAGVAVEIDGGIWNNGGHTRGAGREDDMVKEAALALAGWRLLRVSGTLVKSGHAVRWAAALLNGSSAHPSMFPLPSELRVLRAQTSHSRRR